MDTFWYVFDLVTFACIAIGPLVYYYSKRSARCFAWAIRRRSRFILTSALLVSTGAFFKLSSMFWDIPITLPQQAMLKGGMAGTMLLVLWQMTAHLIRNKYYGSKKAAAAVAFAARVGEVAPIANDTAVQEVGRMT